jgi:Astacin (Peptidase family M12A)
MTRKINLLLFAFTALLLSCDKENVDSTSTNQSSCLDCKAEEAFPSMAFKEVTFDYKGQKISVIQKGDHYILGGDIVLSPDQVALLQGKSNPSSRTAINSITKIWPNHIVFFTINPAMPDQFRVTNAIAHWQANTNVIFRVRTTETNYIEFISDDGCYSDVGLTGGRQIISLGNGCTTGNAIHEIGHAIGFYHEQTRSDRDNTIVINFDNIESGKENNFKKYTDLGLGGLQLQGFDFGSIMLYGSYFFTSNQLPTIVRRDGTTFDVQRNALSQGDIDTYNYLYNRPYLELLSTNFQIIDTNTQQGWTRDVYINAYTDASKTTPMNAVNNLEVHYVVVQNGNNRSTGSITLPRGSNSIRLGKSSSITTTTGIKKTTTVGFALTDLIQ